MTEPTKEDMALSIEPKSDQLNADDLVTGPRIVTVMNVSRGDREQPIVVHIDGHRPYKPCKSMRRVLIALWSDDPRKWVGQRMELYLDPEVKYGGVKVGGIRIRALSGITEPKSLLLTQTRGKKAEVTVFPLPVLTDDDKAYIESARQDIAICETEEELRAIGFVLKNKPQLVQDELRPIYGQKVDELKEQGSGTEANE